MTARHARSFMLLAFSALGFACLPHLAVAQIGGGGGGLVGGGVVQRVVGGVHIDANGVVGNVDAAISPDLRRAIADSITPSADQKDVQQESSLRMISLRSLEKAIAAAKVEGRPLAPEYQFLAGLQRIEFVVLSPNKDDIFIGGPAEGWKVNEQGIVVGTKSGTPVIQLEDLVTALRTSEASRTGHGISVSIDPTEKGARDYQRLMKSMQTQNVSFNPQMSGELEKTMGDQVVSLTGVPQDSRLAQVLVAADYKMKRYSMGFEKAPVADLPSVMEMAAKKNARLDAPRFWMECNYQPVARSEDGTVWQIRGQGVKALTEESLFNRQGQKTTTGKSHPLAAEWAKGMTEKFNQLAAAEPCFRELRNVFDLTVVAALISREGLIEKAGLNLQTILDSTTLALPSWNVPKTVPTQCSYVKSSNSWLVSASGGVQLDPWGVAQQQETVAQLNQIAATTPAENQWWWNVAK